MHKITLPNDRLWDNIEQLSNHLAIVRLIINLGQEDLLPTALEDLHWDAQNILDEHCVHDCGHGDERE